MKLVVENIIICFYLFLALDNTWQLRSDAMRIQSDCIIYLEPENAV